MTAQGKQHLERSSQLSLESLIHSARIVVREIGSIAQWADREPGISHYFTIMHAYDMACAHLTQLDPDGAAEFIKQTYGPAFRQTEVTK